MGDKPETMREYLERRLKRARERFPADSPVVKMYERQLAVLEEAPRTAQETFLGRPME